MSARERKREGGRALPGCEHGQSCMGVVIVVVLVDPRLQAVLGVVMFVT